MAPKSSSMVRDAGPGDTPSQPLATSAAPRPGRPEAAAAIWRWHERRGSAPLAAGHGRLGGLIRAVIGGAIGGGFFALGWSTLGTIALAFACLTLVLALAAPALLDQLTRGLANGIGRLTTWILMGAIFYGFFVPFRLVARRGRRDAMKRFYDPDQGSYWEPRSRATSGRERPF